MIVLTSIKINTKMLEKKKVRRKITRNGKKCKKVLCENREKLENYVDYGKYIC